MSYASETFSNCLNGIFGVDPSKATDLHESISSDLFERGSDSLGSSDQTFDEVKSDIVSRLPRIVVYDYGKKAALLLLGGLAVFALPEEIIYLIGAALVFVVLKSTTATAHELRESVAKNLETIFGNIEKGFFGKV